MVECFLAKEDVASSSLVSRSINRLYGDFLIKSLLKLHMVKSLDLVDTYQLCPDNFNRIFKKSNR